MCELHVRSPFWLHSQDDVLQNRSPYSEGVRTHSWQLLLHTLPPSLPCCPPQSKHHRGLGHEEGLRSPCQRASTLCAEPTAWRVEQLAAGKVHPRPLLGRCSFCTEAPGLALRGLLLSLCFCGRSSHVTLHVTDSPRQVGRKGAPGRETACAKVCRNRRTPMLRAVLGAGPHSGHTGTALSRVHDLPCCSLPHNGKDFLPASCV